MPFAPSAGGDSAVDLAAELLEQADVALMALDLSGVVTHWNAGAARLSGRAAADVIGRQLADVGLAPDVPEVAAELARTVRAGGSFNGEMSFGTGRRSVVVHVHAMPVRDAAGIVTGIALAGTDATLLGESSAQVALSRALFDQSPVGVGVFDLDGRYVRLNPALLDIIGRPPAEILGRRISDAVGGDLGSEADRLLRQVIAGGPPVVNRELSGETVGRPSQRTYLVSYFRLTGRLNRTLGGASLVNDVTDQRRTVEALRRAHERLALLDRATDVLSGSLDLSVTLSRFAAIAVPAFSDLCVVDLVEADGRLRRAAVVEGGGPAPVVSTVETGGWAPVGDVVDYPPGHPVSAAMASGTPTLMTADPSTYDYAAVAPSARSAAHAAAIGLRAALTVPMRARGETLGVASFGMSVSGRSYDDDDLALAVQLVDRASTAIDNARLYGLQQRTALALQRSLLPARLPHAPGLQAAARYLPAAGGGQVGGDWYDLIPLSAGRVAIVVGDVMGRGVQAAALMGQLRAAVRAYAVQDLPPAQVLTHLDELVRGLDESMIVTCAYAVYDPVDEELCLSMAGHVPPLLLGPDTVRTLTVRGTPLGVGFGEPYDQKVVAFGSGTALALYTDGLVESRGEDIDVGIERLSRALWPLPEDIEDACREAVVALERDHHHDDDVAILLLRPDRTTRPRATVEDLGGGAAEVGRARRLTRRVLLGWGEADDLVDAAQLLVSELVTNAVQHAGTASRLRLSRHADGVVIEVSDGNDGLPHRRRLTLDSESGRGLPLVDAFASDWGSRPLPAGGKVVWCRIAADAGARARADRGGAAGSARVPRDGGG